MLAQTPIHLDSGHDTELAASWFSVKSASRMAKGRQLLLGFLLKVQPVWPKAGSTRLDAAESAITWPRSMKDSNASGSI